MNQKSQTCTKKTPTGKAIKILRQASVKNDKLVCPSSHNLPLGYSTHNDRHAHQQWSQPSFQSDQ